MRRHYLDTELVHFKPWQCGDCGCLTLNQNIHNAWHDKQATHVTPCRFEFCGIQCELYNNHDGLHEIKDVHGVIEFGVKK